MHEKLVIIPRKKTTAKTAFNIALFALACLLFVLAMYNPVFFSIPAVLLAVFWFFQSFRSEVEYEYTYYDGDFSFAKIKAKRKRKGLGKVSMEDVLAIAPKGDRSVYKYENDRNISRKDLTSGDAGAKVYELIFKGDKGICRYEIEPDEEMLNEIAMKYPRLLTK